ncbi:possible excisionase [Rhodococcus jostii RHA1]|uniref:Possible excisionase n=1 Tax=Rhodococcus jostii (strain RHA1) TaxID=101510 RepID=Q0S8B2_RHOJR|nr:possible excisionase [Rhodococcus jostii RHA1]
MTISTPEGSAPLPDSVRRLLVDAVTALDRGQAVTVEPHRTVLTTQEAAELLGITRPTLVRLLGREDSVLVAGQAPAGGVGGRAGLSTTRARAMRSGVRGDGARGNPRPRRRR